MTLLSRYSDTRGSTLPSQSCFSKLLYNLAKQCHLLIKIFILDNSTGSKNESESYELLSFKVY